jgi:cytochrome b-561
MNHIQIDNTSEDDPFKPSALTIIVTPVVVILPLLATFVWVFSYLPVELRGLPTKSPNWDSSHEAWKTFNWHPILMTLFLTMGGLAIFCFKMLPGDHFFKKIMHAIFHTFAVVCSIAGFIFMVWWKAKTGNEGFWSLHSWIGIAVLVLYWIQFLGGFLAFLLPGPFLFAKKVRAQFVLMHRHAGLMFWVIVAAVVLTGFVSRQWYMLMGQSSLPGLDNQRYASYWGANAVGLLTSALIVLALFIFRHIKPVQDEHHYSPIQAISYH